MSTFRALTTLRHPLAALAICALLAQQLVGVVLTASPVMALEAGFSLCLSGPPSADEDPKRIVEGAGFCACTLHSAAGVLVASAALTQPPAIEATRTSIPRTHGALGAPATGPPPARAPPAALHI